jgi:diacylglycerol kinase (ATP)
MKQKIRFIINPISGVGDKNELPHIIETNLDHSKFEYDIAHTEYRKHGKKIAYEASLEGIDIICAVGGDGSVHEVGTALIGTPTKLAILPCGSGNGLARHLGIPMDLSKAIECINKDESLRMDTVVVNDKPFLGIGGYGFDAVIAKKFDKSVKRGFWSYVKLVTKEFGRFRPVNVSIEINGESRELKVVLCTIANASEFGNGFVVSPTSDITDGKIELCLLKPFGFLTAPGVVYRFFKRTSHLSRFVEVITFEKARIRLSDRIAHYDGEPFDVREELNVEVVPQSLTIIKGFK